MTKATTLTQIQNQMAQAIMRPLVEGKINPDSPANFVKPNQRISGLERLEIYNQQYWIRLLESLQEDFAGLNAILGDNCFERLTTEYLVNHPSRSYSLNGLGRMLPKFILKNPDFTKPHYQLAYETALFEWSEIVAYDAPEKKPFDPKKVQGNDPYKIVLKMQPHLNILELHYAIDDFLLNLNKPIDKSMESNAFLSRVKKTTKVALPKKKHIFVVVYRLVNTIYYKRINSDQYHILKAIESGKSLAQVCQEFIQDKPDYKNKHSLARKLNQYFAEWSQLHWFSK
jgi:hypothetical protein